MIHHALGVNKSVVVVILWFFVKMGQK